MAIYDPIVPRPKDGSRRASGDLPDSLQRALYQEMLSAELGRRPEGFVSAEPGRSWRDLVAPVAGMLILALLVLAGFWVFSVWQRDEVGWRLPAKTESYGERVLRVQDRIRAPEAETPTESEMEQMLNPPKNAEDGDEGADSPQ